MLKDKEPQTASTETVLHSINMPRSVPSQVMNPIHVIRAVGAGVFVVQARKSKQNCSCILTSFAEICFSPFIVDMQ